MSDIAREVESAYRLPERTAGSISIRPPTAIHPGERRDQPSRAAIVHRGSLTLAQAQQEILRRDANGAFVRNGGRP
jgi:hypothetical protein